MGPRIGVILSVVLLSGACTAEPVVPEPDRATPHGQVVVQHVAEGDLISVTRSSIGLGLDVLLDVSPDGTKVLGAKAIREPTGITREIELAIHDVPTGQRTVIRAAGPREDIGPAAWSPDGRQVAYRLGVYRVDPARVHPGEPGIQTLCVIDLHAATDRCFPESGTVFSFDWSPDGANVLVGGPGTDPVRELDIATGEARTILPPGGTRSIRRALEMAGHGRPDQYVLPIWSPSGRSLAALASMRGGDAAYVPVVFGLAGGFVAMGRASTESCLIAWSPADDVLAYTTSKAPYQTTGAFVLHPAAGRNDRLMRFDAAGLADELVWSPDGRWLSVSWGGDSYAVFRA